MTTLIELICTHCKVVFSRPHKQWKYQTRKSGDNYQPFCSNACQHAGRIVARIIPCAFCSKEVERTPGELKKTDNTFCSSSCSAKFNNQVRKDIGFTTKGKTKIAICIDCKIELLVSVHIPNNNVRCNECDTKKLFLEGKIRDDGSYIRAIVIMQCLLCSSEYESFEGRKKYCDGCLKIIRSNAGKKSAQVQQRRSKNEILFADLCQKQFTNVSTNEQFFIDHNGNKWDADVILHDQKVAVLWNGVWHYKQISKKQSLAQVQSRDKIKLSVIADNNYTVYVIKDMGKHNPEFVEEEFQKFIEWLNNKNSNK